MTMVIQIAGQNITNSCGLTQRIADEFIALSSANTLSEETMWFLTSVEDGPAVLARNSTLVPIAPNAAVRAFADTHFDSVRASPLLSQSLPVQSTPAQSSSVQLATVASSPSESPSSSGSRSSTPSRTAVPSAVELIKLFNGSATFSITAFVTSLSVDLVAGSYVDYIRTQNIVQVLQERNVTDVEWTGWVVTPKKIDVRSQPSVPEVTPLTGGTVSAIVVLSVMAVGLTAFIALEVAMTGAAVAATSVSPV